MSKDLKGFFSEEDNKSIRRDEIIQDNNKSICNMVISLCDDIRNWVHGDNDIFLDDFVMSKLNTIDTCIVSILEDEKRQLEGDCENE